MNVASVTVGDELLIGQVVDTNAAWIGEQLNLVGARVTCNITVGDDDADIQRALARAFEEAELVLVTGGLGPTHDDVTREAVAAFFGAPLSLDEAVLAALEERFSKRGRPMASINRRQAMVPQGFTVLPNPKGTAPGLWYAEAQGEEERLIAVLPGVPHEMKYLLEAEVLPRLRERSGLEFIEHRTLLTTGIGESSLEDKMGDLSAYLNHSVRLASLPSTSGVRLRLTGRGSAVADVVADLDRLEAYLRERVGRYIFGAGDETLEGVVGRLLRERNLTVAVAESCTGGHVANRMTNVGGSSSYFLGGIIAYGNHVKYDLLGVPDDVLERDGAVSEAVARHMAVGVRRQLGADIGVSTTGIAGPGGGTEDKPVGTVWVGFADANGDRAVHFHFVDDRILNKELTGTAVLNMLRMSVTRTGVTE